MRPNFSESEIKAILDHRSSIDVVGVKSLGSYIDQNFLVLDRQNNSHLIKVHAADEKPWVLDLQTDVLKFLNQKALPFKIPNVIDIDGETRTVIEDSKGSYWLRQLSFLPGDLLKDQAPISSETLSEAGQMVGTLDNALTDYDHPAAMRSDMDWDLRRAPYIRQFANLIQESDLRRWAEYFFLYYEVQIEKKLLNLPTQITHHDGHRMSIITEEGEDAPKISGMIDFGDVLRAPRICNLSVTVSDLIVGQSDKISAALEIIRGYHAVNPITADEIDLTYYLTGLRLAIYASHSARSKHEDPDNNHAQSKLTDVRETLRDLISINPVNWTNTIRRACGFDPIGKTTSSARKTLVNARNQHFSKSLYTHYEAPVTLESGALQYLYDKDGTTYLDCVNNVCQWGHCHPHIVRAAQEQIARLNTNSRYVYEPMSELAERLTSTMPDGLDTVFFVNSGSEANDLAARLARAYTGNNDLIVVDRAYHGNSSLATDISPNRIDRPGRPGLPKHVRKTECPDLYRGQFRDTDPEASEKYLQDLNSVVSDMVENGRPPAAFFAESLVGTGGQIVFPDGYLQGVYKSVRGAGGICIADEVQVGFGRTGHHMWCFETQSVVPDIVTMGKPMGNGHPVAAVVTRREIADAFDNGITYFNTFGGNPVSCATALAVLDVLEGEELMANTVKIGDRLVGGLKTLQTSFPEIGDVRGLGLYIGVEIVSDPDARIPDATRAKTIVEHMKSHGVLLNTNGYDNNIIKIKPPLIIDERDVDELLTKLEKVMAL